MQIVWQKCVSPGLAGLRIFAFLRKVNGMNTGNQFLGTERIVEVYGERDQSPEERLRDKDKRRAAYHRFYTSMKWGHAQNYHLTLDSGVVRIDRCVAIIAELYG